MTLTQMLYTLLNPGQKVRDVGEHCGKGRRGIAVILVVGPADDTKQLVAAAARVQAERRIPVILLQT